MSHYISKIILENKGSAPKSTRNSVSESPPCDPPLSNGKVTTPILQKPENIASIRLVWRPKSTAGTGINLNPGTSAPAPLHLNPIVNCSQLPSTSNVQLMDTPTQLKFSSGLPSSQSGFLKPTSEGSKNHILRKCVTDELNSSEPIAQTKQRWRAPFSSSGSVGDISTGFDKENGKATIINQVSYTSPRSGGMKTDRYEKQLQEVKTHHSVRHPGLTNISEVKEIAGVTGSVSERIKALNSRSTNLDSTIPKYLKTNRISQAEPLNYRFNSVKTAPKEEPGNCVQAQIERHTLTRSNGPGIRDLSLRRPSSVPSFVADSTPVVSVENLLNSAVEHRLDESSKFTSERCWTNNSMSSIASSSSFASSISNQTLLHAAHEQKHCGGASALFPGEGSSTDDSRSSKRWINRHDSAENVQLIQEPRATSFLRRSKTASVFSRTSGIQRITSFFKSGDRTIGKAKSVPPNSSTGTTHTSSDSTVDNQEPDYSPASNLEPADFDEKCDQIIQTIHDPKKMKSFYAAREILSSEKTFVNVLHLITTSFPSSIESTAKRLRLPNRASIISDKDLADIQGELPLIKVYNEYILKDLYDRIYNWKENAKIADIFVTKGPFLKHHTQYIKDFEKHVQIFDNLCKKRPHFATAVREFESSKHMKLMDLKSYMLKPVQRIPQYSLLLEAYLKTLEEDHPDRENTKRAIEIVKSVSEHANETIREKKSFEQLMRLQARLQDYVIVGEKRTIIKEGELQKASRKENQSRYFALMTDMLLGMTYSTMASTPHKNTPLRLKYHLPLGNLKVKLPSYDETGCEFSIISRARSFNCFAKSTRERDEWVSALQQTIQQFVQTCVVIEPRLDPGTARYSRSVGKEAPSMVPDARSSSCQSCAKEFTLTFRRHHCRACGHVVCKTCSSNEAPLEYLEYNSGRVCETCYNILLNDFQLDHPKNSVLYVKNHSKFKSKNRGGSLQRGLISSNAIEFPPKSGLPQETVDTKSNVSGYLFWNETGFWERNWALLKEDVLYFFDEPHDTIAVKTLSLHNWSMEIGCIEEEDKEFRCLKLSHFGTYDVFLQIVDQEMTQNWETALSKVTIPS